MIDFLIKCYGRFYLIDIHHDHGCVFEPFTELLCLMYETFTNLLCLMFLLNSFTVLEQQV